MKLRFLIFGKWVEYGRVHPSSKKFLPKGAGSGSRDSFWDEVTLFKFRKCIDCAWRVPQHGLKIPQNGCDVGHVTAV